MPYAWDFSTLAPYYGLIWQGLGVTMIFTVTTVAAGLLLGLGCGILRTTAPRWVSLPLSVVIEFFRCSPLLVLLVWVYYALPVLLGIELSATAACFLALTFYAAAFYAEIFRGGIDAVDRGQWEAARALGMRRNKMFRRIVLPQAIRMMIPSFINQTVLQLKNTSLVSVVAVGDLLYQGSVITAAIYRPLEIYTFVAALYFIILYPLTLVSQWAEKRLGGHR